MFPSKGLLSLPFILLAGVDAGAVARRSGKPTLAISRESDHPRSLGLVEQDHARIEAMKPGSGVERQKIQYGGFGVQYTGERYVVQVKVGKPPSNYTLVLDTASASTWVGAREDNPYIKQDFGRFTGHNYTVFYPFLEETWSGEEVIDIVGLSDDLGGFQHIGIPRAVSSNNPTAIDGFLGVGPVALTSNTVSGRERVLTVMENHYWLNWLSENVLGVFLKPGRQTGELTLGGFDASAINGSMHYFPVTMTSPASKYWGLDLSIKYGNDTILSSAAGIFASSVPFIALPPNVYNNYKAKTGANIDLATGYLTVTSDQYTNLESLVFNIGGVLFTLTPNAQIWPRQHNLISGGSTDKIYLVVSNLGKLAEPGLQVVIGYSFLERFYSVFDTTNGRIGLAYTNYTFDEVN